MAKKSKTLIRSTEWQIARAEPFGAHIDLTVTNGYIPNKTVSVELSVKEAKAVIKQIEAAIEKASTYKESW